MTGDDLDDDTGIPDDDDTPGAAITPRRKRNKTDRLLEGQRILEQLRAGVEPMRICADLGISRATLYRRVDEARRFVIDPTVEQYRADAVARLNMTRLRVAEELTRRDPRTLIDADTGDVVIVPAVRGTEVASLVTAYLRAEDTEAKLRGAYAPQQVDHTVRVEDALSRLAAEFGLHDDTHTVGRP